MGQHHTFYSSHRQLRRARRKNADLETVQTEILTEKSFELQRGLQWVGPRLRGVLKIRFVGEYPEEAEELAVEALEALRSALDQAAYASAVTLGTEPDPKSAYFPFADNEAGLKDVVARRCKSIHRDVVAVMAAFKPYQEGNRLLWAMNKARNKGQHATLIGFATGADVMSIATMHVRSSGGLSLWAPNWDMMRRECIVATFEPDAGLEFRGFNTDTYLAFADAGPLTGEPVVTALNTLACETERIVMAIEAETVRIQRERAI